MKAASDKPKGLNDITVLLLFGLGVAIVHVITNGQYGFHRDELDILMNCLLYTSDAADE